jgi:hypothetical protein
MQRHIPLDLQDFVNDALKTELRKSVGRRSRGSGLRVADIDRYPTMDSHSAPARQRRPAELLWNKRPRGAPPHTGSLRRHPPLAAQDLLDSGRWTKPRNFHGAFGSWTSRDTPPPQALRRAVEDL